MSRFAFALIFSMYLSGCALTDAKIADNSEPYVVNNVVIAEPFGVNFQTEIQIAKLSQLINHAELDKEKMAQLLYDRGVYYDNLGLRTLAHLDFRRAIEHKPDFADAYNFVGIHLTLLEQYAQAFEAFDSALEIDPDHNFVHLNRGIALYYYGREQLAMEDIEQFHAKAPEDPYRAIWLYFTEANTDPEGARLRLIYNAAMLSQAQWAYKIVDRMIGNISDQEFIASMTKSLASPRELNERLCEGYFYLGKMKLLEGKTEAAKNFFRLALATDINEFVEFKYARLELGRLYQKQQQESARDKANAG
jgi:lipoprotein NlpI